MPTLKKFSTSVRIYCLVAPNQPLLLNFHLLRLVHLDFGCKIGAVSRIHVRPLVGLLLALLLIGITFIQQDASALSSDESNEQKKQDFVNDQVLVGFNPAAPQERADAIMRDVNAEIVSEITSLGIYVLKIPRGAVEETVLNLRHQPGILLAEPNYYVYADDTIPSDPGFGSQYGLINIRAPQGWDLSTGATWVTIAVLDSGVDLSHPDLAYKTLPGYDFVNNDDIPQDDYGHGTHVAGIAAAASNNGAGITGVSWGANIMPLKVLNSSGGGTYANVAAGIVWATDHGAQVINMSLGGSYPSSVLEDAVNYAYTRGMVQVAAAGNSGSGTVLYPARYAPVIAVAATDNFNSHAGFSNYGPEVDLAAPGVSIYSLYPGGGYGYRSGTSMAAPFVSGLAAILIGLPGNYDAGYVEGQMESAALDLGAAGWDVYYGAGLIQMDAALQLAIPPTPTPTATPISTATYTTTSTFTLTPSPTPTNTATSTPSATPTFTSTSTYTPSATATFTPTSTSTKTSAPTPGRNGNPFFPLSGFFINTATGTNTPTASPTNTTTFLPLPTQPTVSAIPDAQPTSTPQEEQPQTQGWFSWQFCAGLSSLLTGLSLFWIVRRGRKRNRFSVRGKIR